MQLIQCWILSRLDVKEQLQDASGVTQESFWTRASAERMWKRIIINGWNEVLEPTDPTGHVGVANQPANASRRPLGPSQSLSAIEDLHDDGLPIHGSSGNWHVVTRGRRPGVYPNWYVAILSMLCPSLGAHFFVGLKHLLL